MDTRVGAGIVSNAAVPIGSFSAQLSDLELPEPLPLDHGSEEAVPFNFDTVFKSIMEHKGQQVPGLAPAVHQHPSQDGSDLSTIFHQSSIGSLAEQLRHSASGLERFFGDLPVPAVDSDGVWAMDGTPLNLTNFSGTPLTELLRQDVGLLPSSHPETLHTSCITLPFEERTPVVVVDLLPPAPRTEGRPSGALHVEADDEGLHQSGRKRRRKGELPPKLAAILAKEKSSSLEECCFLDAQEDVRQSSANSSSRAQLDRSHAEVRRDKNREAARRVRQKREHAILELQLEVDILASQNTGLSSHLQVLLDKLDKTNKDNSAMRELLKCLDVHESVRKQQPVLERLYRAKTVLSGPANPPPQEPWVPPIKTASKDAASLPQPECPRESKAAEVVDLPSVQYPADVLQPARTGAAAQGTAALNCGSAARAPQGHTRATLPLHHFPAGAAISMSATAPVSTATAQVGTAATQLAVKSNGEPHTQHSYAGLEYPYHVLQRQQNVPAPQASRAATSSYYPQGHPSTTAQPVGASGGRRPMPSASPQQQGASSMQSNFVRQSVGAPQAPAVHQCSHSARCSQAGPGMLAPVHHWQTGEPQQPAAHLRPGQGLSALHPAPASSSHGRSSLSAPAAKGVPQRGQMLPPPARHALPIWQHGRPMDQGQGPQFASENLPSPSSHINCNKACNQPESHAHEQQSGKQTSAAGYPSIQTAVAGMQQETRPGLAVVTPQLPGRLQPRQTFMPPRTTVLPSTQAS